MPVSLQVKGVGPDVDLPSYAVTGGQGKHLGFKLLSYKFILLLHVNSYPKPPSSYLIKVKVES